MDILEEVLECDRRELDTNLRGLHEWVIVSDQRVISKHSGSGKTHIRDVRLQREVDAAVGVVARQVERLDLHAALKAVHALERDILIQ